MEDNNTEKIELENVVVPDDDIGDLINVLFQAGFSDEETDIVMEAVFDMKSMPEGGVMLDEEIIKICDKFESLDNELSDEDLAIIRQELLKRFS
ncbi:MAG: hypothetical protein PF572_03555 [Patescibacteria group bacterium]|jgi:hypothetical protein|nr:hypothetical protein [Patescibacteria group bacterium]